MARMKKREDRKCLLSISKKLPAAAQELVKIRGDFAEVKEEFNTYKDNDRTIKLMKKKKCSLFINVTENHFTLGRTYDNQLLDIYRFKIHEMKSSEGFSGVAAELSMKYFLLFQNCVDERLQNLVIDLLMQKSHEVDLNGTRYAWIFGHKDKVYTFKYVRVLNDYSVEDIGPYFVMEIEKSFNCGDELWKEALNIEKVKKTKNVEKNVFKDKIGKIHIDRQDLKDIKLKKGRGYKYND